MGLDCSHDAWHGAYSSFARWRNWIAVQLDWDFEVDAQGNDKNYIIPDGRIPDVPTERYPIFDGLQDITENGNAFYGDWFEAPADVIDVLMVHSDCEGRIPARFCRPLAERLSLIMQEADPGDPSWRPNTISFIEGLLRAANRNEDVDFH